MVFENCLWRLAWGHLLNLLVSGMEYEFQYAYIWRSFWAALSLSCIHTYSLLLYCLSVSHEGSVGEPGLLSLQCAHKKPGNSVKMQVLPQEVWAAARPIANELQMISRCWSVDHPLRYEGEDKFMPFLDILEQMLSSGFRCWVSHGLLLGSICIILFLWKHKYLLLCVRLRAGFSGTSKSLLQGQGSCLRSLYSTPKRENVANSEKGLILSAKGGLQARWWEGDSRVYSEFCRELQSTYFLWNVEGNTLQAQGCINESSVLMWESCLCV